MKPILIVFFLIACALIHIYMDDDLNSETSLQSGLFYDEETMLRPELAYAEEQQWLEFLREEADYIKLKDGQQIYGNTIGKDGQSRMLYIEPLSEDTILKVSYEDIERFDFREDEDFLTDEELKSSL